MQAILRTGWVYGLTNNREYIGRIKRVAVEKISFGSYGRKAMFVQGYGTVRYLMFTMMSSEFMFFS